MVNEFDYVQAATMVRVQEKNLLNYARIHRMLDAKDYEEFLKFLSESSYSKSISDVDDTYNIGEILSNELKYTYILAYELIRKHTEIIDIFALKYDYQNLKLKLKAEIRKKEIKLNFLTNTNFDKEYELVKKIYDDSSDIQLALIQLDKLYYSRIKDIVFKYDIDSLKEYYTKLVNKYNLLCFLRLKAQGRDAKFASNCFIDDSELYPLYLQSNYEEKLGRKYGIKLNEKSLSEVEKILENSIVNLFKKYKAKNRGIEPIISFVLAKEYEMKAIKLIATAKINKLDQELIKERLRDIYV